MKHYNGIMIFSIYFMLLLLSWRPFAGKHCCCVFMKLSNPKTLFLSRKCPAQGPKLDTWNYGWLSGCVTALSSATLNFTWHFIWSHKILPPFVTGCPYYFKQLYVMYDLCPSLPVPFPCYSWAIWREQTSVQIPEISMGIFTPLRKMAISPAPFSQIPMPAHSPSGSSVSLKCLWGETFLDNLSHHVCYPFLEIGNRISRCHTDFSQVDHICHSFFHVSSRVLETSSSRSFLCGHLPVSATGGYGHQDFADLFLSSTSIAFRPSASW